MAAFFMREVVWQLVGARTWRARQVLYDTCEPDLSERAPHVAPLQKKALSSWDSAFFHIYKRFSFCQQEFDNSV